MRIVRVFAHPLMMLLVVTLVMQSIMVEMLSPTVALALGWLALVVACAQLSATIVVALDEWRRR